jgi:hypothetical protein
MRLHEARSALARPTVSGVLSLIGILSLLGAPFLATAVLHRLGPVTSTVVWTGVLLASFTGWGTIANDLLAPNRRADAGLRMAWGVAACMWIGGALLLVHAGSRGPLTVMVAVGLVALSLDLWQRLPSRSGLGRHVVRRAFTSWPTWVFVAAVMPLVVAQIAGEAVDLNLNPADDLLAYLAFPKEMLEAGTFLQPFSFRRIGSYGGQSFLQALMLIASQPQRLYAVDRGLCLGLFVALIVGHARVVGRVARIAVMLTALVVLTIPIVRTNTASAISGAAAFVALYRTMSWAGLPQRGDVRAAILVGAMAGFAWTLRQNFLVVALGVLFTSGALSIVWARGGWPARRLAFRDLVLSVAATIGFVLPWALSSYASSRTLLYPVMAGSINSEFSAVGREQPLKQTLEDFWPHLTTDSPTKTILLVALGALFLRDRGARPTLRPFLLACFVGFLVLLPQIDWDQRRYRYGFELGFFVLVGLAAASELPTMFRRTATGAWAAVVVVIGCASQTMEARVGAVTMYTQLVGWIKEPSTAPSTIDLSVEHAYLEAQASIPRDAKVLSVVDYPYYFDYGRNALYNIDFPGVMSPAPGIPWKRGPDALAAYLQSLSIRYVVVIDSQSSVHMFKRSAWEAHAKEIPSVWGHWAGYVLELFDSLDKLSATHRHLYEGSGLTVIDLGAPRN